MLSARAQKLLDLKCAELKLTVAEQNKFVTDAAVQQAKSGIMGNAAAAGYVIRSHFEFFRSRVKASQDGAVEVINASDSSEDLDAIPDYLHGKIMLFLADMHKKVTAISTAPYSRAEPDLAAVYAKLKADFDFRAGVAIAHQKKEKPMSKSYHIHGANFGQMGDDNKQELVAKVGSMPTASGHGDVTVAPKAEKAGWLKYVVYPIIVGVVLLIVGVLIKKYSTG
ncbi:MAG TPA: hypothetical protein VGM64_21055 [Lacunisphaera sp.]|jgi:hypothetical protein